MGLGAPLTRTKARDATDQHIVKYVTGADCNQVWLSNLRKRLRKKAEKAPTMEHLGRESEHREHAQ